jgi:hypothetical protein
MAHEGKSILCIGHRPALKSTHIVADILSLGALDIAGAQTRLHARGNKIGRYQVAMIARHEQSQYVDFVDLASDDPAAAGDFYATVSGWGKAGENPQVPESYTRE